MFAEAMGYKKVVFYYFTAKKATTGFLRRPLEIKVPLFINLFKVKKRLRAGRILTRVPTGAYITPTLQRRLKRLLYAGSQAPAWEPSEQSSSFASREARASRTEFPSRSLGTSTNVFFDSFFM